jgi:hypothetical protein
VKVCLAGRWYTVILQSIGRKNLAGACHSFLRKFLELIVHRTAVLTVRIHLLPAASLLRTAGEGARPELRADLQAHPGPADRGIPFDDDDLDRIAPRRTIPATASAARVIYLTGSNAGLYILQFEGA